MKIHEKISIIFSDSGHEEKGFGEVVAGMIPNLSSGLK